MATIEDRIRERRRALADRARIGEFFPVPGYSGDLWIKLRFLPSRENDEINATIPIPFDRVIRKLVVCCEGFYESQTQTRKDLTRVEVDGVPVLFDRLLAGRYGFLEEVRINGDVQPEDVVRGLMSDYLVEQLHAVWSVWMVSVPDSAPEVAADPVGESEPTPPSDEPPSSS